MRERQKENNKGGKLETQQRQGYRRMQLHLLRQSNVSHQIHLHSAQTVFVVERMNTNRTNNKCVEIRVTFLLLRKTYFWLRQMTPAGNATRSCVLFKSELLARLWQSVATTTSVAPIGACPFHLSRVPADSIPVFFPLSHTGPTDAPQPPTKSLNFIETHGDSLFHHPPKSSCFIKFA